MALFAKVLSGFSKPWISKQGNTHLFLRGIRHCSGLSGLPSPQLPVEEIENIGSGPCLMFADEKNDDTEKEGGEIRRCYSFSTGKRFTLRAPQLQGRRCWGTQYGWLITLGLDRQMHLFNPLTQQQLSIPSQHTFKILPVEHNWFIDPEVMCSVFIKNFSLSSNPSDSSRPPVIMSIYGACYLAFASPGDEAWRSLKFKPLSSLGCRAVNYDVIFYEDHFYSFNNHGELCRCHINSNMPKENPIASFPKKMERGQKFYLVNISGDLHLICRTNFHRNTESFDVYRFDFVKAEWIGVQDLKSHTIFVGNNTTFAISAVDYPEVKANCIYFTDDHMSYYLDPLGDYPAGICDMGVYDFENDIFLEPFIPMYRGEDSLSNFSRPFFFMPSPCDENTK